MTMRFTDATGLYVTLTRDGVDYTGPWPPVDGEWAKWVREVNGEPSPFMAPAAPEPAPLSKSELTAYAADRRWRRETGGIVIGGIPVATDDRSKIMVLGARIAARADPEWTTVWHGADGGTYPLNAAAMLAISNAIEAHVNGTFATFAIVKAGIEAGETTTIAEIDAAFG